MIFYCLAFIIIWSTPGYTKLPSSSKARSSEEIDHVYIAFNNITKLYLSHRLSDVVLVVGKEKFHAHRILLALRSGYFSDLFYGDNKTDDFEVNISAEPENLFKILLGYLYTAQIQSSILKGKDDISKFFDMSDTFKVSHLQSVRPKTNMRFNDRITHIELLMSDIKTLFESKKFSDVVLHLGEEQFHAHRFLLASHSEFFKVLLCEDNKEKDVIINEGSTTSFEKLLRYMYTGQLDLNDLKKGDIFELYKISDYYNVLTLKHKLHKSLRKSINLYNVCSFLDTTRLYQLKELEVQSLNFIDSNALRVLYQYDFPDLSPGALEDILNRDTFYANELDIFNAVCLWINKNQNKVDDDTKIKILSAVRYSLMSDEEQSKARESQLVGSDIISDAIQFRKSLTQDKPQYRARLIPNENLAYENHDHYSTGINMIELNKPSIINFLQITLWYKPDDRNRMMIDHLKCFSYYVEVSTNGVDWTRVIDHSNYNCRSLQNLWFHPQIVRYIRFVGTGSTANVPFKLWDVRYDSKEKHMFENDNGLVVPKGNVASKSMNAVVIKGENSVNHESLLDKYKEGNSRHDTYTYHLLESDGSIVVQLTQPYILSSMRMLLWGDDSQYYSYTIEVSDNNGRWDMIVDKSEEKTRSWQLFKFKARPIGYIRITGKFSSTDNVFRCVYLEAPAQVPLDSNVVQDDRAVTNTLIYDIKIE